MSTKILIADDFRRIGSAVKRTIRSRFAGSQITLISGPRIRLFLSKNLSWNKLDELGQLAEDYFQARSPAPSEEGNSRASYKSSSDKT